MKKIMTVLLAAITAVMMTATSFAAEDPAALMERVNAKNSSIDSMDCDLGVHLAMVMEDENIDEELKMDMAMKLQMDHVQSGSLRYKAEAATEFLGETNYAVLFYKDGYYYIDSDGTKMKYQMDMDAIMEKARNAALLAPEVETSYMKNLSVREENGMKILSYEMDASAMNGYIQNQNALSDLLGSTGVNVSIRQVNGEYVINQDDYCTALKMYMVMDMSVMGENGTIIMLIEGDINNPGQPVEIAFPSTDGYQDSGIYPGSAAE